MEPCESVRRLCRLLLEESAEISSSSLSVLVGLFQLLSAQPDEVPVVPENLDHSHDLTL